MRASPRGVPANASECQRKSPLWWHGQPSANVGLRCDGLVVLDLDDGGRASLETLQSWLGKLPETRTQRSGRGGREKGLHLLYSVPIDAPVGNSTRAFGRPRGLDLRAGAKGYIVAAPSLHASGSRYRWLDPEAPIAPLPEAWLERLLRPKPVEPAEWAAVSSNGSTAYGRGALRSELAQLARVPVGQRNEALNRSAYALAGWVPSGEIDEDELRGLLFSAGLELGLSRTEVERTVSSGIAAGVLRPRRRTR